MSVLPAESGGPPRLSPESPALCVAADGAAARLPTGGQTRHPGWFGAGWHVVTTGFSALDPVGVSPVAVIVTMVVPGAVFPIAACAKDEP
jgi:hypothetical protein